MNKRKFGTAIAGLCVAFDRECTTPLLKIYEQVLGGLTDEQVEAAVAKALTSTDSRMPTPGQLLALAVGSPEQRAIVAWNSVLEAMPLGPYAHVNFQDRVINATIRTLDGWPALFDQCSSSTQTGWYRREFIRVYQSLDRATGDVCRPLPGLSETSGSKIVEGEKIFLPPKVNAIECDCKRPYAEPKRLDVVQSVAGKLTTGVTNAVSRNQD